MDILLTPLRLFHRSGRLTLLVVLGSAGCGVLVGNPEKPKGGTTVTGTVVLGRVAEADVVIYQLAADGSLGEILATTTTDADGTYTADVDAEGPILVLAKGGAYVDEATESTVPNSVELETYVEAVEDGAHVGVNALTTIAVANANRNAAKGLAVAIAAANADVATLFGLQGVDIVRVKPSDLTKSGEELDATSAEARLGLVMAGFSRLALDNGLAPGEVGRLARSIGEDYADGGLDGLRDGESLATESDLAPYDALNGFGDAVKGFAASPQNRSGIATSNVVIKVPAPPQKPTQHPGGRPGRP